MWPQFRGKVWFIRLTWPHAYVWHDSFICVIGRIHMCDMTDSYAWHDLLINVTHSHSRWHMWRNWFIHFYISPHSYVWHDWIICMTWLIHVPGRIHMCDMTESYVWHDSFTYLAAFICVTWLNHTPRVYRLYSLATHYDTLRHTTTHYDILRHTTPTHSLSRSVKTCSVIHPTYN